MTYILPDTELLKIKVEKEEPNRATFIIEPLTPGFGHTIGNALRRVLLSKIEGAAITQVKIDGMGHEFSALPNVKEDSVELLLNLKGVKLSYQGEEPALLTLNVKGPKTVLAGHFGKNPLIEIANPEHPIVLLDKGGELKIEATVEKGRGFLTTEARAEEKIPLGTILLDAYFSPVVLVNSIVEDTRVGRATNYEKIVLEVETNGTKNPRECLKEAMEILTEHVILLSNLVGEIAPLSSLEDKDKESKKIRKSREKKVSKPKKAVK
ncbi:DNA-directed RNA polymerase subunit alpha [Candidatus Berkelbacteria bacterium]|nr:DNA-directed RNA polymerase subunit alpha [Candidatus Berkelbacteria bacterium]